MIPPHADQQPRHRILPFLTIGLAVLGLVVTSTMAWLAQQERHADIGRQWEVLARQLDALRQVQEACQSDEACLRKVEQQEEEVREQLLQLRGLDVFSKVGAPAVAVTERWDMKVLKLIGGAVVTVPVLCCALYVITSRRYKDTDKKWAYGAVGTLLGFWLGAG